MKIALVGSHGTGKSSAANHLGALLKKHDPSKSVKVLEENVREVARLANNQINTPEFQKLCFTHHLYHEFLYEALYNVLICDRSAVDTLVYGLASGVSLPSEYFNVALLNLNKFDHVFFVRPDALDAKIAVDGFRSVDVEFRGKVDMFFEHVLKLWGGKYTEIRTREVFSFDYLNEMGL
jgi:nicotinamide riboside kinase